MTTPNVPYGASNTAGVDFYSIYTPPTSGSQLYGTPAPFAVGTFVDGTGGSKWVYVLLSSGGTTGQGYAVTFNGQTFVAVMMSNSVGALGDKIGVPCCGAAASGDYIWVQVYGACANLRVNGAVAVNTALASTSTAGALDDATTTGTKNISGIVLTTLASTASLAPAELNWPIIGSTN